MFVRFFKTIFLGRSISDAYLAAHWDSIFYPLRAGPNFGLDPGVVQVFMPQLFFVSDFWHHAIPVWNQFTGFGAPLLADPEAFVLAPVFALFYMFPSMYMWNITLVLELLVCSISTYLLAIELECSVVGAVAAALLFTFCPWGQYHLEVLGTSICLTSVVFLFFVRAAKRKSLWHTVAAGIVAALVVLSGHPEISFVSILTACLFMC